jgi:predicted transcriptional regulator
MSENSEVTDVRKVLELVIHVHGVSARSIGRSTGISYSTVNRFLKGGDIVVSNYMAIREWVLSTPLRLGE